MPLVSIVIINYHTEHLLEMCLQSLFHYHPHTHIEIIIVNNGGDLQNLAFNFQNKPVRIITLDQNPGFSAANNYGAEHASGEYILFLNSDTEFIEPVIDECIEELKKNTHIGILGCRLLNKDGSLQYSYHDGDKWLRKLIWRNPLVIKFLGGSKMAEHSKIMNSYYHSYNHYVRWISGAFMLFKKDDFLENGEWDTKFFMYWEDVELCYRFRKKGKRIYYFRDRSIIHLGGGGKNISIERFSIMERSKMIWLRKSCIIFPFIYMLFMKLNLKMDSFFLRRKSETPDEILQLELDFYNNNKHKRP